MQLMHHRTDSRIQLDVLSTLRYLNISTCLIGALLTCIVHCPRLLKSSNVSVFATLIFSELLHTASNLSSACWRRLAEVTINAPQTKTNTHTLKESDLTPLIRKQTFGQSHSDLTAAKNWPSIPCVCTTLAFLVSAHSFASFPQCEQDFQPGNCSDKVGSYTFDKTARKCVLKEFSCCPGNDNHFQLKTECQERCETDRGNSPNHLKSSVEDMTTWESFTSF
ncbi:Uncharacterised protein r2_g1503 [Pycnogonum litorale]